MQLLMVPGILPDSWFPDRASCSRFIRLLTLEGRSPSNKLSDKTKYAEIVVKFIFSFGMKPVRWLLDKSRAMSFLKSPKLDGIDPSMLLVFFLRTRVVGSSPERLLTQS